jgi:hypothetical protein
MDECADPRTVDLDLCSDTIDFLSIGKADG